MKFNEEQSNVMYENQKQHVIQSLIELRVLYDELMKSRYSNTLTRSKYIAYELFDIIIPLTSILAESNKKDMNPDYMLEKIQNILNKAESFKEYFQIIKENGGIDNG